ncbi:MAG: hypothetical protein RQ723_00575 [Desulfuromonadales bacterium]|nr:hypothetical protein [Desulfuromonadales bacterium]
MIAPDSLIINTPYEVPAQHWQQAADGTLSLASTRRPAGYEIIDMRYNTRRNEPLELVNRIRERVDAWRGADYPGITSVTRRLDSKSTRPLFADNDRFSGKGYPRNFG